MMIPYDNLREVLDAHGGDDSLSRVFRCRDGRRSTRHDCTHVALRSYSAAFLVPGQWRDLRPCRRWAPLLLEVEER